MRRSWRTNIGEGRRMARAGFDAAAAANRRLSGGPLEEGERRPRESSSGGRLGCVEKEM
jgi:hypothetical protein